MLLTTAGDYDKFLTQACEGKLGEITLNPAPKETVETLLRIKNNVFLVLVLGKVSFTKGLSPVKNSDIFDPPEGYTPCMLNVIERTPKY